MITCTVSSATNLWWVLTDLGKTRVYEHYSYTTTSELEQVGMIGDFELRLKSYEPLVSTATMSDTDPKHNGTVLACANDISYPLPEEIAIITILVEGKLRVCYSLIEMYIILRWQV